MRKFLRRIVVFALPFFLLCVVKKAITPHQLGDSLHAEKLVHFQQNQDYYNTVLFGSSRIYRHINPAVLDTSLAERGVRSFNFATPSTMNPESYYLFEKFLEGLEKNQVRYAILEANVLIDPARNAATTKGSYWNTWSNLNYSLQYLWASGRPKAEVLSSAGNYLRSFLYSFLDFSLLNPQRRAREHAPIIQYHQNGYFALEDEIAFLDQGNSLLQRRAKFQADTSRLVERISPAQDYEVYSQQSATYNHVHFARLQHLLQLAETKGIHLFFLLPPRLKAEAYQELVPLLHQFPSEHVLSLYAYPAYQDFYSARYSFDIGHFNKEGADIFSRRVAAMMSAKLENEASK